MKFHKYHALGNDYIVINPTENEFNLQPEKIKLLCDRNFGIGSDGILYGPTNTKEKQFALRIFNPDGSEAEKSGNGIRIFTRYLWDTGLVKNEPFDISTLGGIVSSQVLGNGDYVKVEMGKISFNASDIPVQGISGEVLNQELLIGQTKIKYCAATIGNPHCIVLCEEVSPELAKTLGPQLETNPIFANRTNVQFMQVINSAKIKIEIWERGAGYTLASGSSSTAAAAVAYKLGLCGHDIEVIMPGGSINITFSDDFKATMRGPVVAVYDGKIRDDFFNKSTQPIPTLPKGKG
jgi:diaminopimelate epimerase